MTRIVIALFLAFAGVLEAGTFVAGIDIVVKKKPGSSQAGRAATDASGVYRISGLAAGDYTIEASLPSGYVFNRTTRMNSTEVVNNSRSNIKNNAVGEEVAGKSSRPALASGPNVANDKLQIAAAVNPGQTVLFSEDLTLTDTADITGVITFEDVSLSTTSLRFVAIQGGSPPASQALQISSNSDNRVSYSAEFTPERRSGVWTADLTNASGSLSPGSGTVIQVQPSIAGLAPGTYLGQIKIGFADGDRAFDRVAAATVVVLSRADSAKLPIAASAKMDFAPLIDATNYAPSTVEITNLDSVSRSYTAVPLKSDDGNVGSRRLRGEGRLDQRAMNRNSRSAFVGKGSARRGFAFALTAASFASCLCASPILYVGDYSAARVNVYDASNLSVGNIPSPLLSVPFIGSNQPAGNPAITRVESIRGVDNFIYVAVQGGLINQYDLTTGASTGKFISTGSNVYDMATSSDGTKLYVAQGSFVRSYSLQTSTFGNLLKQHTTPNSWGVSILRSTGEVYVNNGWTSGVSSAGVYKFDSDLVPVGGRVDVVQTGVNTLTAGVGLEVLPDGSFYAVNSSRTAGTGLFDSTLPSFVNYYAVDGTLKSHIVIANSNFDAFGTAIGPNGNLFVANFVGADVIEIDTSNNQFLGVYLPHEADLTSAKTLFFSTQTVISTPEPATFYLLAISLAGFAVITNRNRRTSRRDLERAVSPLPRHN